MPATSDRIEKTIVLKAPRARVWRAIGNAEEFGRWFGVRFEGPFESGTTLHGVIVPTTVDPEVAKLQEPHAGKPFAMKQHLERLAHAGRRGPSLVLRHVLVEKHHVTACTSCGTLYTLRPRSAGLMVQQPRDGCLPSFQGYGTEKHLKPYGVGRQHRGPENFPARVSVEDVRGEYRRWESDGVVRHPGMAGKQGPLPELDEPGLHRDRRGICHRPFRG